MSSSKPGDHAQVPAVIPPSQVPVALDFSNDQVEIIRATLASGLTNPEFDLFMEVCKAAALNPILKQIYAWKIKGKLIIHVGINGHRAIAQRSGFFGGSGRPLFGRPMPCKWDPKLTVPEECEVTVWRLVPGGGSIRTVGYCRFDEFARTVFDNGKVRLTEMWHDMPHNQLAKCTEAQGLQKGFQHDFAQVFETVQKFGVLLDLRGDMGGDEPPGLEAGTQAALTAGKPADDRLIVPGVRPETAATLAAMHAAAQPSAAEQDRLRREASVREQFRREEGRAPAPAAATPGNGSGEVAAPTLGELFGYWKDVHGEEKPQTEEEKEAIRQKRIRMMGEIIGRPIDSWNDLTAAERKEAKSRLLVLRDERREAAAADPHASDATVDQADRQPGDEPSARSAGAQAAEDLFGSRQARRGP